jgi:hypothetical protein
MSTSPSEHLATESSQVFEQGRALTVLNLIHPLDRAVNDDKKKVILDWVDEKSHQFESRL